MICEKVDAGGVKAEWIAVPGAAADRVILYLHGGGYVIGSINTHRAMVSRIARASNARALSLDYRLAPEHPFPAAVDDATAAYKWLLGQGYKPGKIVIAGDSAGGGLTLAALLAIRAPGCRCRRERFRFRRGLILKARENRFAPEPRET